MLGRRPHDRLSAPICAWHHRLAPGCCDPAQGKFWDRLNVDPAALCTALYAAFKAGEPGAPIVIAAAGSVVPRNQKDSAQ